MQLCASQLAGIKACAHAIKSMFQRDDTEAVLLVDSSNAINTLNRLTALLNIQGLYPTLATPLINIYRAPSNLYIDGIILSQGGITQGDPRALPMYAFRGRSRML